MYFPLHYFPVKCNITAIQWNSVNMVTNGPKKFGRINEGFFCEKMYGCLARRPKQVAVITR